MHWQWQLYYGQLFLQFPGVLCGLAVGLLRYYYYYYVCRENGICRKYDITSHGLRHERLSEVYHTITGQLTPIKSCVTSAASVMDQVARQEIAEIAGHSCLSVASAYIGAVK